MIYGVVNPKMLPLLTKLDVGNSVQSFASKLHLALPPHVRSSIRLSTLTKSDFVSRPAIEF
jgi:hypothetical protein